MKFTESKEKFIETWGNLGSQWGVNKSIAQISLRFVLQNGLLPLPKSTNEDRIKQNADLDFEISADDMNYLNSLEINL